MVNRKALQEGNLSPTAKRLGKLVKHVLSDADGRAAFKENPKDSAKKYGAGLDDKDFEDPDFAVMVERLRGLSPEQLKVLVDLNEDWPLFVNQEVDSFHPLMVF